MTPTPMQLLLTDLGLVVTEVVSTISDIVGAIVAQPILLIPVGLGLLGIGVALVKRFI